MLSYGVKMCYAAIFSALGKFHRKISQQKKQTKVCWLADSCHEALTAVVKLCVFWEHNMESFSPTEQVC